jgi:hypothetical protein
MVVDLCGYKGVHDTPQHVLGEVECLSLLTVAIIPLNLLFGFGCLSLLIVALLSLMSRLLGIVCLYLLRDLAVLTPLLS